MITSWTWKHIVKSCSLSNMSTFPLWLLSFIFLKKALCPQEYNFFYKFTILCRCVSVCVYFLALSIEMVLKQQHYRTLNISNVYFLISKYHCPLKGIGEIRNPLTYSRPWNINILLPKEERAQRLIRSCQKGHRSWFEGDPVSQIWDNLRRKEERMNN